MIVFLAGSIPSLARITPDQSFSRCIRLGFPTSSHAAASFFKAAWRGRGVRRGAGNHTTQI